MQVETSGRRHFSSQKIASEIGVAKVDWARFRCQARSGKSVLVVDGCNNAARVAGSVSGSQSVLVSISVSINHRYYIISMH